MSAYNVRLYRPRDANEMHAAALESVAEVYPWMAWCHERYSLDEARQWIAVQEDLEAAPLASALVWAGRAGSDRRIALPNGTASGSVTPAMDRRAFISTFAGVLAAPLVGEAQSAPKIWQIGWLYEGQAANIVGAINFFREEFKKLGYVESRDYLIHSRSADGHIERLAELAAELTGLPVDVLITSSTPTALAATHATRVIPIVMVGVADPVGSGLVRSFDRPGGNATGTALALDEVSRKWLEFLKAVRANLSRVAVLHNPTNPGVRAMVGPLQEAARILTVTLTFHEFTPATAEASVFRAMAKDRPHGIVVLPDAFINDHGYSVVEQIARMRLPAIYAFRGYVVAGGLMSYGPDTRHMAGKAAGYVDKIVKGARPGDLPIERPTQFNLVINLKTAKALGLTIPPSLLQRADQVIE